MDRTTAATGEQREDRAAEASPAADMPDAMFGYAGAAHSMLWMIETARAMLELNRTLLDLGRDVFRRQQDAAIAAALRSLGASEAPDRRPAEAGFADLARLGVEAFERITAAMRAANGAALRPSTSELEAERKAAQR